MESFNDAAGFNADQLQAVIVGLVILCACVWGAMNIKGHLALFQDERISGLELVNAVLKVCALAICIIGFFAFAGIP